ncbi:MAG TPA: hypothetical protein VFN35_23655 [Ktedonobacteraceae bacterium]|nr:hypothetical protein [Ktedonobacteraceae bacterium]
MPTHSRTVLGSIIVVGLVMVSILGLHIGGDATLKFGVFSALAGAFIGGILVFTSVNWKMRSGENVEPWTKREQLAWILIGLGCIAWGIGECFWRYYLTQGEDSIPFPSLADLGYASFPPLVFAGLILQPSSKSSHKQLFLLLDSLIAMGALLSIAWFLLLGSLAQSGEQSVLARALGLYYPTTDVALLSCIIFILLRGPDRLYQAPARRIGLLVVGLGLAIFAVSDFVFNLRQNLGTFVEGTWVDLGWPLGMMIVGVAAYLRRFLPKASAESSVEKSELEARQTRFGPVQALPYFLLALLFCVLVFNILSSNPDQQAIRPVLLIATILVTGLVVIRQVVTMIENDRLMKEQMNTLQKLENVYQDIEKQKATLEAGINHLKEVQTRLSNGDVRARAQNVNNDLWPLAAGLNLMADRMMRTEHVQRQAQKLTKAIADLEQALRRKLEGGQFVLPASCVDVPEIHGLLWALGLGAKPEAPHIVQSQPGSSQAALLPRNPGSPFPNRSSISPIRSRNEPGIENLNVPPQRPSSSLGD